MQRLDSQQRLILQLLEHREAQPLQLPLTAVQAELQHKELTELLLELLSSQQPEPGAEIARLIGLPPQPTSSPSSVS